MTQRKMTIPQLLDSVPMNGVLVVYAPIADVIECAQQRNSTLNGEWFTVSAITDRSNRTAVVISRKELWNIANAELLMKELRRWHRVDNVWRT